MRLVDTLVSCDGGAGVTEARAAHSLFGGEGEPIDEIAFIELIAQSCAAVKGYDDLVRGRRPCGGSLVGIRDFRVTGRASGGETLRISIRTVATFERFAVVEGEVAGRLGPVAAGTLVLQYADG